MRSESVRKLSPRRIRDRGGHDNTVLDEHVALRHIVERWHSLALDDLDLVRLRRTVARNRDDPVVQCRNIALESKQRLFVSLRNHLTAVGVLTSATLSVTRPMRPPSFRVQP